MTDDPEYPPRGVTIDYMVPLTVRIDMDTKEILEVWLHLEGFQGGPEFPLKYELDGKEYTTYFKDVFFWGDAWPAEVIGRELGPDEHPLVREALEVGGKVNIVPAEVKLERIDASQKENVEYQNWRHPGRSLLSYTVDEVNRCGP